MQSQSHARRSGEQGAKVGRFRVVIVDADRLFREGLERLLRSSKFRVVGSAKTLEELDLGPGPDRPDVVVCGFNRDTKVEDQFKQFCSHQMSSPRPRIVVLTRCPDRELVSGAAAAGIDAVLSKDISREVLQRSLELVVLGQQVFPAQALGSSLNGSASLAAAGLVSVARGETLAAGPHVFTATSAEPAAPESPAATKPGLSGPGQGGAPLSDREEQILRRLVAGAPNKIIARDLGITEGTVKVHVKSLLRKLGAANRTQAAIWGNHRISVSGDPPRSPVMNGNARALRVGRPMVPDASDKK